MRSFIRTHEIFAPGPVVVACSGGPDSVALLGILHALSDELGLVLHLAHFDHRIRATSARDARLAQRIASELRLPSHLGAAARAPRSEAEARDARYRFLRSIARDTGARAIALGHTRDDQAETVLLHLARGSGVVGLAAMRPRRDDLARPLLCLTRAETAAYATAMGVRPARDPSNRDLRYARNLVRLRVMPLLERINPKAPEALARLADNAALLAEIHRSRAEEALREAMLPGEGGEVVIDLDRLDEGEAIRSEALAIAAERASVGVLSERQRRALLALSKEREGSARLDLPRRAVALREYARLVIGARREPATPPEAVRLEPGKTIRWGAWSFLLGDDRSNERDLPLEGRADAGAELLVRAWRAGDRIAGGKKVQDILTDAKVPRRLRSTYPVVVTREGDVVWVPALAGARATAAETGVRLAARPPRPGQA